VIDLKSHVLSLVVCVGCSVSVDTLHPNYKCLHRANSFSDQLSSILLVTIVMGRETYILRYPGVLITAQLLHSGHVSMSVVLIML
jgi:hypothetical protein